MGKKLHVTIVHDNNMHDKSFVDLVKRYHDIKVVDIGLLCEEDFKQSLLIIVQVNLTDPNSLRPLKRKMALPEREHIPVLFLLDDFSRREIVQSNILGATDYIAYPCPESNFIEIMADLVSQTVEKSWAKLSHTQEMALKVSLKVMEDAFENAMNGEKLSHEELKNSCDLILEATAKDGLTDWMKQTFKSSYLAESEIRIMNLSISHIHWKALPGFTPSFFNIIASGQKPVKAVWNRFKPTKAARPSQ